MYNLHSIAIQVIPFFSLVIVKDLFVCSTQPTFAVNFQLGALAFVCFSPFAKDLTVKKFFYCHWSVASHGKLVGPCPT